MDAKIFIHDLNSGHDLDSAFLVLSQSQGRTSRGGAYLNVELGDRTGKVAAKVWDGAEALAPVLAEGRVALVRGYVDTFRGALQVVIREAAPAKEGEFDWADFLMASPFSPEKMRGQLWELVEGIGDADFRRLVSAALRHETVADKFYLMPAAKSMHHAYLHGLLEHSLSVAGLAKMVGGHYPGLNADLLLAGAILHDLGKVWEFSPPPKVDYATIGRLKGHLVMGAEFLERLGEAIEFPQEKLNLLVHLILSHHGEPEFGAPVRPQLLEAVVLHYLDNVDAKMEAVTSLLNSGSDGDGWSAYHRLLGSHFLRTPEFGAAEPGPPEPEKPISEDKPEQNDTPPEKLETGLLF
jgi:3'-5' exoribonuclease